MSLSKSNDDYRLITFVLSIIFIFFSLIITISAFQFLSIKKSLSPKISSVPTLPAKTLPSASPAKTPTPDPVLTNFTSSSDKFSVYYRPARRLYTAITSYGRRYTFYSSPGNITVHVSDYTWAWIHSGRELSSDFKLDSQPSFQAKVSGQTLVDARFDSKFYTVQCVHGNSSSLEAECSEFLQSFKFL